MQRSRQKKSARFFIFFTLVIIIVAFAFRYELLLQLQSARFRGLGKEKFSRIWVHRVNSTERYELVKDKFQGIEMDVSFNDKTGELDVRHQPTASAADTLTLGNFLQHIDLRRQRVWLDMRLVTVAIMQRALDTLMRLDQRFHFKEACIVELYNPEAAALFASHGYTVSYNLNYPMQRRLLANAQLRDSVDRKLSGVKYISRDGRDLLPVKKLFPNKKIITWHAAFTDFINRKAIRDLLDDPQVDIILVNIKTPYYR